MEVSGNEVRVVQWMSRDSKRGRNFYDVGIVMMENIFTRKSVGILIFECLTKISESLFLTISTVSCSLLWIRKHYMKYCLILMRQSSDTCLIKNMDDQPLLNKLQKK